MKIVHAAVAAVFLAGAAPAALLAGATPAAAQTQLDHDVQRAWDNVFHPGPPGDPRTNWERRRDARRYEAAQAQREAYWHNRAERDEWCRAHPGAEACGR